MVAPAHHQDTYVDVELSANLDSTYAFEGPEKLLEVWFWPDELIPRPYNPEGLRAIPLTQWVKMLDLVNCKVLSMKSCKFMDAYLLSELSLFVFPHKVILKTCGTTTTLACLDELFASVSKYLLAEAPVLNSKSVFKVFYSRRAFMFPEKQKHVHRDWKHEVKLLNQYFVNGKLYVVGDVMSDDHWYLYVGGSTDHASRGGDQTFEILMTNLDPAKAEAFVTNRKPGKESYVEDDVDSDLGHDLGKQTMACTKLDSLFGSHFDQLPTPCVSDVDTDVEIERKSPSFIHDAFSFTPCGFSSNSISNSGYYYTLHITPEDGWSYASFETNYPFGEGDVTISSVLMKVLDVFEPGSFIVTLINEHEDLSSSMSSISSSCSATFAELGTCDTALAKRGYKKHDKITYDLHNEYNLLYMHFVKH